MKVFLIYNGRGFGRQDILLKDGKAPVVPLRQYAEMAGARVLQDEESGQAMVSYCGSDLLVANHGAVPGASSEHVWADLDQLAEFLRVRWTLAEDNQVLVMGRTEPSLTGQRLVLDPGHGGDDVGATGVGLREKDINLVVSRVLAGMLRLSGAEVVVTRRDDSAVSLADRLTLAQTFAPDAFVSLHHNSHWFQGTNGTEIYYYENWAGSRLAAYILNQLVEELGTRNRGTKEAGFYVLRQLEAPSVLVETAFLSNPTNGGELESPVTQYRTAAAIFRGIRQFFEEKQQTLS